MVKCTPGVRGWSKWLEKWIVERIFTRLLDNRRLVVDYERTVQTSETLTLGGGDPLGAPLSREADDAPIAISAR